MTARAKTRLLNLLKSMLKEGMSLEKISLCIAMGIALGIFPVLGMTTLLCTVAAFALRLNLPAIQAVNYMVYPLQIILLAPFYGIGAWWVNHQGRHLIAGDLIALLSDDFWGSVAGLWDLMLYAILTWLVISPFIVLILYMALKPLIGSLNVFRGRRLSPRADIQ